MKLKQKFVLRKIAEDTVLVPISNVTDTFEGIISLNETGIYIWKQIEIGKNECEIAEALIQEYDVDFQKAKEDVSQLCAQLRELGILE